MKHDVGFYIITLLSSQPFSFLTTLYEDILNGRVATGPLPYGCRPELNNEVTRFSYTSFHIKLVIQAEWRRLISVVSYGQAACCVILLVSVIVAIGEL